MARRRASRPPHKIPGPPRNRIMDGQLFDDAGEEWMAVRNDMTRAEVLHLLTDSSVALGIHRNYGDPLRWIPANRRTQVWREEIEPEFFDNPNWRPPVDAPGQLPYRALLYRAGDRQLLLFDCLD